MGDIITEFITLMSFCGVSAGKLSGVLLMCGNTGIKLLQSFRSCFVQARLDLDQPHRDQQISRLQKL